MPNCRLDFGSGGMIYQTADGPFLNQMVGTLVRYLRDLLK